MISVLLRGYSTYMTWRELEWGLEHLKLNDDDLKSIGAYQSAIRLDKMRNAFAGDRAFLLPSFRLSFKEVDYLGKQQKENMASQQKDRPNEKTESKRECRTLPEQEPESLKKWLRPPT